MARFDSDTETVLTESARHREWHLVADIGGTNARFAMAQPSSGRLIYVEIFDVTAFANVDEALARFLDSVASRHEWRPKPAAACLAVAGVPEDSVIEITNSHWRLSLDRLRRQLGPCPVHVINDFAAIAWAVPLFKPSDWRQLGNGKAMVGKPSIVLGPGTGLGVGTVAFTGNDYIVLDGQGGHMDFAPTNDLEIELLKRLRLQFGRVSTERLLSGQGIVNIYRALADIEGQAAALTRPDQITRDAMKSPAGLAHNTLNVFCAVLGSVAGDLALVAGARGGVYLGGGILRRIFDFLPASNFRSRFEAKGRYAGYNRQIPTRVITLDNPGLTGAALCLERLL